jgi:SNF2 family DNA or RNA helicase
MVCRLTLSDGRLVIEDRERLLRGRHHSQMAVWGLHFDTPSNSYVGKTYEQGLLEKVTGYFLRTKVPYELAPEVELVKAEQESQSRHFTIAREQGARLKQAEPVSGELKPFLDFLGGLPRRLKPHQIKAAIHLLAVGNGANFSVPGSGKTTVVLSVFEWLKQRGIVNTLFVVGPPSCFGPWRDEFASVLGRSPCFEILAGGQVEERRRKYYPSIGDLRDLYLTSFQTLQRDVGLVKALFSQPDVRAFLVVDEAHYIKQLAGVWADAVLTIAPLAKMRCILTGTPFPQSYADAYNYFDALWPGHSPIARQQRIRITAHIQKKEDDEAGRLLTACIGPLFYRVRKADLCLAPQEFRAPTLVTMKPHERRIYDAVVDKIRSLAVDDDYQEFELLTRLRQGRMMRLRQCISYCKLLGTAVTHYDENLLTGNPSLSNAIRCYDDLETPAKLDAVLKLVDELRNCGEKVVVWSNFVGTLKMIQRAICLRRHRAELIYGATPSETAEETDALTREAIIKQFKARDSGLDVLVANPAACAESISLHTACSNAIYYDVSYNCAQYLQSLDRIHRVGGSEEKVAHYHFLQYHDTIDPDILASVRRKAHNMSAVIDQECPVYSLDMFSDEDELAAYEQLFTR